jgi:outer membrane protein assembly factor BamB
MYECQNKNLRLILSTYPLSDLFYNGHKALETNRKGRIFFAFDKSRGEERLTFLIEGFEFEIDQP